VMHVEDGAEQDIPTIVGLLADKAVEVRRAAALALTRLGTPAEVPALRQACKDPDWQVRFAAAVALEAHGVAPDVEESLAHIVELNVIWLGLDGLKQNWQDYLKRQLTWKVPPATALRAAGK